MPGTNSPVILIIDDEEANRYAVGHILKRNGYQVTEADSWKNGAVHVAEKPGLIVLDVQLPDANGFEICRELKADPATQSIPVLMTSAAFVKSRDKAQGLDSGAEGYLTTPIDPLELVATVRALLRIREAEEKLRVAYQKAEAANAAKMAFLANISHEIRTPMNVIMGVAEILERTSLTHQQKECVSTLQISARSLLELINDVLDSAKLENESVELESMPFDLNQLMERIMAMMDVRAEEKKLSLTLDAGGLEHRYYRGDPLRLQQIIVNLVSNAIKFTSQGSVAIKVSDRPGGDAKTRDVTVVVSDTGIGIPADKLETIFEKFTQGDISTTRKYGGSGLGLSISRSLAEKMKGVIGVSSAPRQGSVFTLTIPLRQEQVANVAPGLVAEGRKSDSEEAAKGRILVVEDYEANILVTTTFLDDMGYSYDTALNGNEALKKFDSARYDGILMDIQMQGMDGYQATRLIREREKAQNLPAVPIIALTAHAMSGEAQKCLEAGMDDYISKPYRFADLQAKLKNRIKRRL
jgi:signal transduction histidine kinase